jgi:hypothetical protein
MTSPRIKTDKPTVTGSSRPTTDSNTDNLPTLKAWNKNMAKIKIKIERENNVPIWEIVRVKIEPPTKGVSTTVESRQMKNRLSIFPIFFVERWMKKSPSAQPIIGMKANKISGFIMF